MSNFIRPCEGYVTSPFGPRKHPVTGVLGMMHNGVDIAKPGYVPILAAAGGRVSRVQPDKTFGTYGNLVMIVHNIGGKTYETVYAHLKTYAVKVGQTVKQGDVIGVMGNTGGSTGQHLHFEIHAGGRWNNAYTYAVDPLPFITSKVAAVVTPIKPKEVDVRMFNPKSAALKAFAIDLLTQASTDKLIDASWAQKARTGTLALDDWSVLPAYIEAQRKKAK